MCPIKGKLVLIGGAEDKKGPCLILRKFIELAGNQESRIVVITAATDLPQEVGHQYSMVFKELGCQRVEVLEVPDRASVSGPKALELINMATGVFFTGGDQLQITSALGGTELMKTIHEQYGQGIVVGGTSAGASAMSSTMIIQGNSDESPKLNTLKMSPGMGLLPDVVIDQHFAQRGRIGRLLTALGQNPSVLGLGLDEDTAVIVVNDNLQVWGSQTVTVLDGREVTHTNASSTEQDEYLALTRVITHILPHGYSFNLRTRRPSF